MPVFPLPEAGGRGFVLPDDVGTLEAAMVEYRIKLVVIDLLMAHIGSNVNSFRDQDVR